MAFLSMSRFLRPVAKMRPSSRLAICGRGNIGPRWMRDGRCRSWMCHVKSAPPPTTALRRRRSWLAVAAPGHSVSPWICEQWKPRGVLAKRARKPRRGVRGRGEAGEGGGSEEGAGIADHADCGHRRIRVRRHPLREAGGHAARAVRKVADTYRDPNCVVGWRSVEEESVL